MRPTLCLLDLIFIQSCRKWNVMIFSLFYKCKNDPTAETEWEIDMTQSHMNTQTDNNVFSLLKSLTLLMLQLFCWYFICNCRLLTLIAYCFLPCVLIKAVLSHYLKPIYLNKSIQRHLLSHFKPGTLLSSCIVQRLPVLHLSI